MKQTALALAFSTAFTLTSLARAAPWHEDALYEGEIDAEDVATAPSLLRGTGAPRASPPLARGSSFLSVVGFSRTNTIFEEREVGGFLVLGLPLDRHVDQRRLPLVRASLPLESVQASAPDVNAGTRLARGAVEAAWRAAGLALDDERLDSIVARARWSAILPEARLRAVRFEDARLSLDTGTDTSRLRDSAGANIGFEARLTWRFDRLVYADDEPQFERLRVEHRDARTRIGAKVLEAYVHWQRAATDLRLLPAGQTGSREEADLVLRMVEAEAALDILTQGWFGAHKPRVKRDGARTEQGI